MLAEQCGLTAHSRVLDVGCGQARILTGILRTLGGVREYVGLDVHGPSVDWAQHHLGRAGVSFHQLDVGNERYNPRGGAKPAFPLPSAPGFDVVCLFSVFSHMRRATIEAYLHEIRRVLAPGGRVFASAFVELGVPDEQENPPGYHREWSGPLHCVRVERHGFERLAYDAGLRVRLFRYRHTNDGQSSYVLERDDDAPFVATVVAQGAAHARGRSNEA